MRENNPSEYGTLYTKNELERLSAVCREFNMPLFLDGARLGYGLTADTDVYQMYAFAKPGLKKSETFFLKLVILLGLALFVVGVMFAYKLMMPFMLRFLSTGIEGADYIQTTTSTFQYQPK